MRTDRLRARLVLPVLLCLLTMASSAAAQEGGEASSPAAVEASSGRVVTGDYTVAAGETVDGLVVVGGNLTVAGEVSRDAVVVGGNLILESTGLVLGNAVVTGGEIEDRGGRVRGEMRMMSGDDGDVARALEAAVPTPAATAAPSRQGGDRASHTRPGRGQDHWFSAIGRGIAGILGTLSFGLVLAGVGALLVFYGHRYLETASDTLRVSTIRSGGVGLAAFFLVVPAFVVLVVALAVSIIGIPLLLLAVPLYPLAIAAAVAFGLLASAHALGEHTAEQRREVYDLRYRNSYAYLFTGLGMLLIPLLAADLISMTGFLGFLGALLKVVTWTVIWLAATAGFGAVILSRFGTQRSFIAPTAMDGTIEPDPLFDGEPSPSPGSPDV